MQTNAHSVLAVCLGIVTHSHRSFARRICQNTQSRGTRAIGIGLVTHSRGKQTVHRTLTTNGNTASTNAICIRTQCNGIGTSGLSPRANTDCARVGFGLVAYGHTVACRFAQRAHSHGLVLRNRGLSNGRAIIIGIAVGAHGDGRMVCGLRCTAYGNVVLTAGIGILTHGSGIAASCHAAHTDGNRIETFGTIVTVIAFAAVFAVDADKVDGAGIGRLPHGVQLRTINGIGA